MERDLEPMTTYGFLAALPALEAAGWRRVEAAGRDLDQRFDEWEAAWGLVLALGLDGEARPAMAAAAEAGAGLREQALAGAACAAVAARGQIGERRFRALYRPFAEILPADPEVRPPGAIARLAAHCRLSAAWR